MKYEVIKFFTDKQDNDFAYHVGDTFPREGVTVSDARIEELSTDKNRRGIPLIKAVEEEVKESVSEPEEEPQTPQTGESSPKKTKGKKSTKKAQE